VSRQAAVTLGTQRVTAASPDAVSCCAIGINRVPTSSL